MGGADASVAFVDELEDVLFVIALKKAV